MKLIKAVLFDLDGTLINTNDIIIESFKHTLRQELNLTVETEEIIKYFGEPLKTTMERYDRENVDRLISVYREHNEIIHDSMILPIEGAEEVLEILKGMGIKLGVVTSKRRKIAERGLKLFNLDKYMDVIITPEDTLRHKPDAEPALKACEVLGIKPEEALFVGDSHFDIMCGHNAGMKACFVGYSAIPLRNVALYSPDYIVDSILDIAAIVKDDRSFEFDGKEIV